MSRLIRSITNDFSLESKEVSHEEWPTVSSSLLWLILFWISFISFCFTLGSDGGSNAGFYSQLIFGISFACLTYEDLHKREPLETDEWTILSHAYGIFLSLFYIGWKNHVCDGSILAWLIVIGLSASLTHKVSQGFAYFLNHYDEDSEPRDVQGFFNRIILHSWIGAFVIVIFGIVAAIFKSMWNLLCLAGRTGQSILDYFVRRYKSRIEDVID